MNRELITPADEAHWLQLRTQDLTSTDIAALFGLSPYKTAYELWHEKRSGEVVRIKDNDRMKWGRRLEATVAEGIAEDQGWTVRPFKEYGRLPEVRIGASFDFRIMWGRDASDEPQGFRAFDTDIDAILEIKTVDSLAFRNGWTVEPDYVEAPAHIELQVQHQMLVSGLRRAYIGVMIGGNRIEVIQREADDQVHAGIIAKASEFWASIAEGREPEPVMPGDAEAVIRRYQQVEPGKQLDARGDAILAARIADYARLKAEAADVSKLADAAKAEILQMIGDAEKVILDGYSISAGLTSPSLGTLVTPEMVGTYIGARSGFRNFRVTAKKAAAA